MYRGGILVIDCIVIYKGEVGRQREKTRFVFDRESADGVPAAGRHGRVL